MVTFKINGKEIHFEGNENISLLNFLRNDLDITSVKDGCSAQSACGACMVEIDGKAKLACVTKLAKLNGAEITTMEGMPENVKDILAKAFVEKGAVQCGFCTPGFLMRTKVLLQENPNPSKEEIKKALTLNLCRCTGYHKIIEAIEFAAKNINSKTNIELTKTDAKIGKKHPKYQAYETAIGKRKFVNDYKFEGMLHSALKFSDYPRAKVLSIDISKAEKLEGVIKIFTASDIPGSQRVGLIYQDWPMMIKIGETTRYIGDVIAGVVAKNEEIAKEAVDLIKIDYEIYKPITDIHEALSEKEKVHPDHDNLLGNCVIKIGDAEETFKNSKYISSGIFQTQRIEHAFIEPESAIALPDGENKLILYSQSQGVYEDRKQVAKMLGIDEENVRVILVPNGGGFGGKEDMTVQGHVSLFAWILKRPVKLTLSREESITMHPKKHPIYMDIKVACDEKGKLTAVKLRAIGDTGAYASVGTKVMERVAGHCTGGMFVPVIDIEARSVYTNNIPCGALRGFGANQVSFAFEACLDELCFKGGFDRWQFRYDNALVDGLRTSTGQKLKGVGIRESLLAVKEKFSNAKYAGIATAIKNCGVGNGMPDFSDVIIEIIAENHVRLHHGWTEMGQGVHTVALQVLCEETGINPDFIEVMVDTKAGIKTGMTTSSRGTTLVGNAIIDACKVIKEDLKSNKLKDLVGKQYKGSWICDWTTKPGDPNVKEHITHYSYGYATQVAIVDDNGNVERIIAAHDAGKIFNPTMFEGQIQGSVHMGTGYALTEDLPMENGYLLSKKLRDCGVLRAHETPEIDVIGIEVKDPVGPYGAKGIGEIGMIPTAAAIANALYMYDGVRRFKLPMKRK